MKKLCLYATILLFSSCRSKVIDLPSKSMGYKPIYVSYESLRKIELQPARKLKNPGKIYTKDKILYINEVGEGIHVFDNADKSKPKAISFISIPVNQDISIINNVLYADNADELVAIDISNPLEIKVLKRIEKAFPYASYPQQRGRFECADPAKGYVKSWEYVELINPKCSR